MAQTTKSKAANYAAGANERISVSFGNALQDLGMVADLPKAVLWFYRFLDCDGERLDDREVMPLVMIIALKEGLDGQGLRLIDLPSTTPFDTLRRYLTKWKRMGLVFTRSIYYSYSEMKERFAGDPPSTPRLKHVVYDLSNLMFNITMIAQEYARRNLDMLTRWEQSEREGDQPVYQFPEDYAHPVRLSPEVAARIVDEENGYTHKKYIAPKWLDLAREMVKADDTADEAISALREKRANRSGVVQQTGAHCVKSAQTALEQPPHCAENAQTVSAHCAKNAQTLIEDDEEGDEDEIISSLLARFAARKNDPVYAPDGPERGKVRQLLREGYSARQIAAAIDQSLDTRPPGAKPVRGFGFIVSYIHHLPTEDLAENPAGTFTGVTQPTGTSTGETTGDTAGAGRVRDDDPLSRAYLLLQAASIQGIEGVEDVRYDLPGIRLGLRRFLDGSDPFSPDEVYQAVLAAVSRGIQPERLVGYAEAVLENARREEQRERVRVSSAAVLEMVQNVGEAVCDGFEADMESPEVPLASTSLAPPDQKARALWQSALSELELQMTRATFNAWLRPATLLAWESVGNDGLGNGSARVTIGVPNSYIREWLEHRLFTPIQRTLSGIAGQPVEITFQVDEQEPCDEPTL